MLLEPVDHPSRILVVDDERDNRVLLELILQREGFVVTQASSGEDALALVETDPPDLVLLDVLLPGIDGYAVAAAMKANPALKSIPIVMVTALDDRKARLLGLEAGAEDFICKPIDRAELCVRLRNLLRLKACSDEHDRYNQVLEVEVGARTTKLVETERLYRATFDEAPVGIVHVGLVGQWLRINPRFYELLGYAPGELDGESAQHLVIGEQPASDSEAYKELALGNIERHVFEERSFRRRDGNVLWARVNVSAHRHADGQFQFFIMVVEDITEHRRLEAQFRQAGKMEAIGRLAAGVAHDFNNLLSIVLSYSELLASNLRPGDPMRADLGEIRGAGIRAAALTRQLLAFSRQQVLQPQIVELAEVVVGLENMLGRVLGPHIELRVLASGSKAHGRIRVDPGQLEQVVMNLAVNARDAMPTGGKLSITTSEVAVEESYTTALPELKAGAYVLLTVSDTGEGIDREAQARIFEPFFTTKETGKGTGLGLSIVFGIVRQSGGHIGVSSVPGRGTTFEIYFPVVEGAATDSRSIPPPEAVSLHGTETVLIVEDADETRALAHTILRRYGYTVLEAQTGGDALLVSEQHPGPIDLLLTKARMPRLSGRQLAERLGSARPEMRVIYMSGYADETLANDRDRDTSLAFLEKPITPRALALKVRETLDAPPRALGSSPSAADAPVEPNTAP